MKVYRVMTRAKGSEGRWSLQRYLMTTEDYEAARQTVEVHQDGMFEFRWEWANLQLPWEPVEQADD